MMRLLLNRKMVGVSLAFLLGAGCGVTGPVLVAALLGFYLGELNMAFPSVAGRASVSDRTGPSRTEWRQGPDGKRRFSSYEGILPGFVELGTTLATVHPEQGQVTGVVTTAEGDELDLEDVLPGLRVEPRSDGVGFDLAFQDGDLDYRYEMSFDAQATDGGAGLEATASAHRRTAQGDEVLLDDTGEGTLEAVREDVAEGALPDPLPPLPAPIILNMGPDKTISPGETTELEVTIRSGDEYTFTWSPEAGLDDPSVLQATAGPEATTTYTLEVSDIHGQYVLGTVMVTVTEAEVPVESLVVDAGEDRTISAGEVTSLNASVSGGVPPYSYAWSSDPEDDSLVNATEVSAAASPGSATTYTLTVTDSAGNTASGSVTITISAAECGNEIIEDGEECDPPDDADCSDACTLPASAYCGDGNIDWTEGEQCDPPDEVTCDADCQCIPPPCGDGVIDATETCDPPDGLLCDSTCQVICGNDDVQLGEDCDPPDGDACSADCQFTDDECAAVADCGTCTRMYCGWCLDSHQCQSGSADGPDNGSCGGDDWAWSPQFCPGPCDG